MKDKIEYGGYTWDLQGETYGTYIDNKFIAFTWKFGDIHQAKVNVEYDLKIQGESRSKVGFDQVARVCLHHQKSRKGAMKRCLQFVKDFKENGGPTVQQTFEHFNKYHEDWHRIKIIEHLFFVIGNGYDWLDGGLISGPDDHLELLEMREHNSELTKLLDEARTLFKELGKEMEPTYEEISEQMYAGNIYRFYPVSKDYSNICFVPDDVKPDWLNLAYEAALLLRDHSGIPDINSKYITKEERDYKSQEENRKIGADIVRQLETRFPQLKK